MSVEALLREWQSFWLELGVESDFSSLVVPLRQKGFDRLLVVPQGMTPNKLYDLCQNQFPCRRYMDDLDQIKSVRTPDKDYAVWVRGGQEADEELKNLSANDLQKKGVLGITIEERLVFEAKFFKETGEHLDKETITLCSGSRSPDGHVPGVCWYQAYGRILVFWCNPENRRDGLRSRAAVS